MRSQSDFGNGIKLLGAYVGNAVGIVFFDFELGMNSEILFAKLQKEVSLQFHTSL